jgi:4a-hydroxytetrahydrobiopterin dehydratase
MPGSRKLLTTEEIGRHTAEVQGWKVEDGKKLSRSFTFPDFKTGLDFVNRVGEIAERQGHHPDVHLSWGKVGIETWTHDAGGLTEQDFLLASQINHLG